MQVSVENTSAIGRRLTIQIPAETVQAEINTRMNEVLKTRKMDGFRAGKVPKQLVQQKYGAEIRQDAMSRLIESTLPKALQQESLAPAGRPQIDQILNPSEGQDLTYVVSLEIFPEIQLPDFSAIEIKEYQVDVQASDVDKAIENLKNQLATFVPVARGAEKGDRVVLDYSSLMNGKPYPNSSNQDVTVELGSARFIEGFEEGLLKAAAGETRSFDLVFPADWRMQELAGKPVQFTATIKSVSEKQLAELDEAFAKKIGASSSDQDVIRTKIQQDLEKQVKHQVLEQSRKEVLEKVLKQTNIELPKALIQQEMSALHEDLHRKMGDHAHDHCQHTGLEAEATRRVAASLLIREIVKLENLTPNAEQVKERIAEIAKSFGNEKFIENMYYESEELIADIQNSVLVNQAIEVMLAKVKRILTPTSVDALFKQDV